MFISIYFVFSVNISLIELAINYLLSYIALLFLISEWCGVLCRCTDSQASQAVGGGPARARHYSWQSVVSPRTQDRQTVTSTLSVSSDSTSCEARHIQICAMSWFFLTSRHKGKHALQWTCLSLVGTKPEQNTEGSTNYSCWNQSFSWIIKLLLNNTVLTLSQH